MSAPVVIVGGGLSGLTAAYRLHHAGVPCLLLEARQRLGGRILTADPSGEASADGFDLGASWFWPAMQPPLRQLVSELGLQAFPQNNHGDVLIHRMSREAPRRFRSMDQEPQSMRLTGGTGRLIAALAATLPAEAIRLGTQVTHLALRDGSVLVDTITAEGLPATITASHVILALPPRLLEATIGFSPAIAEATARHWRETPTWMAPHAKFFACYDAPFWREAGLSGTAQSMAGPLVEIHDATTASGAAALFGFVGIPAGQRQAMGQEALTRACVAQLTHLFGPLAAAPRATLIKDWAQDKLTATPQDAQGGAHPVATGQPWISGPWQRHVTLAGSETSPQEPGYLAGAVTAAELAAAALLSTLAKA